MNRVNVDKSISELLYQFDCVIIPDFGGFVANYAGAKIQPIQNTFTPPSKQISFNRNLTSNDGLLANFYSGVEWYLFCRSQKRNRQLCFSIC